MAFKTLRTKFITAPLVGMLKRKGALPSISETERTALRAGSVWIEGELFGGKPDFRKILSYAYPELSEAEQAFLDNEVEEVCAMTDDWEVFRSRDLPEAVWDYLKAKRFFGMRPARKASRPASVAFSVGLYELALPFHAAFMVPE